MNTGFPKKRKSAFDKSNTGPASSIHAGAAALRAASNPNSILTTRQQAIQVLRQLLSHPLVPPHFKSVFLEQPLKDDSQI